MYGKVALYKIQTTNKKKPKKFAAGPACAIIKRIKSKSVQATSIGRWARYIKWRIWCWIADHPFYF